MKRLNTSSSDESSDSRSLGSGARVPLVIVTILHWNGGTDTLACLESVHVDGYPNVAIVLVDNGSSDGIVDEVERRWPAITVIRNPVNGGFTGGQNQAIGVAMRQGADFVLMLNQDATLVPGCIAAMVSLANSDARIGLVSPVIHSRSDSERIEFLGSWVDSTNAQVVRGESAAAIRKAESDPATPLALWGTALLIRRAVVEDIGLLDARLFAYYEDLDYSYRSAAAGWRNRMCFDAAILHRRNESRFERPPYYFYFNVRNELLWWGKITKGFQRIRVFRIRFASLLREAGKLRDEGMRAKAEACISGLWDTCTGRFGAYDPKRTAPRWLVRILLGHPYLMANLLEGRLRDAGPAVSGGPKALGHDSDRLRAESSSIQESRHDRAR